MIRVYFDWNTFSYLRQRKDKSEPYKTIFSVIQNNNNKLLFPYSPAHLQDLKKDFNNSESAKAHTYKDLDFLQEMTKGHCLYGTLKEKDVEPSMINVRDYFEDLCSNDIKNNFDIDNLFPQTDSPELAKIWDDLLSQLKLLPGGLNMNEIDNLPEKYNILKDVFKNTKENSSLYNLLKDISQLLITPEEQNQLYKTLRNNSINDMKIDTDPKNWGNAFDYLDKFLPKTSINRNFSEMIENNIKVTKKENEITKFDYFSNYYLSLDSFGYYRDKALPNLIYDTIHSYYGAHCDFFVTEDDNTYQKTKAVYDKLGISTIVCKPNDFLKEYYSFNQILNISTTHLIDQISEIIKSSIILVKSVDDELNPVTVHKISYPLVDYFNRMQVTSMQDSTVLFFYKRGQNYSDFMFWTELETVVNKIVKHLGIDDNLKFEFTEEYDKLSLNNNTWKGRSWRIKNSLLEIIYSPSPYNLSLRVTIYN